MIAPPVVEPHSLVLLDMRERAFEMPGAERMADQNGWIAIDSKRGRVAALLVHLIELVDDHVVEILARAAALEENRNVADLERVGHGDDRALFASSS